MPKRYYWLKLKTDFFSDKRIKKLRALERGDAYAMIYLKMLLQSIASDGVLTWTGLEDSAAAEFALDLDEDPAEVGATLDFLLRVGLAESEDGRGFFFPEAIENTGSEDAVTQRVRAHRNRKALQCNTDETRMKRECNAEKEIEIEIDTEIEKEPETETEPEKEKENKKKAAAFKSPRRKEKREYGTVLIDDVVEFPPGSGEYRPRWEVPT